MIVSFSSLLHWSPRPRVVAPPPASPFVAVEVIWKPLPPSLQTRCIVYWIYAWVMACSVTPRMSQILAAPLLAQHPRTGSGCPSCTAPFRWTRRRYCGRWWCLDNVMHRRSRWWCRNVSTRSSLEAFVRRRSLAGTSLNELFATSLGGLCTRTLRYKCSRNMILYLALNI